MSAGQGPGSITNPKNDRRTLSHRGSEVGSENVALSQNSPDTYTEVISWECPRKFEVIDYAGGIHPTYAELRYLETFSGDGTTTTFALTGDVIAVAGEELLEDQPFDSIVAYDTAGGAELTVDSINYAADEVTFTSAPATGTDNVKIWPVLAEGTAKYVGIDQFNHEIGSLDDWGTAIHTFADHDQLKSTSTIHLTGRASWSENETLALHVDSPRQVVWTDADFPRGEYVSQFRQKVDVSV